MNQHLDHQNREINSAVVQEEIKIQHSAFYHFYCSIGQLCYCYFFCAFIHQMKYREKQKALFIVHSISARLKKC